MKSHLNALAPLTMLVASLSGCGSIDGVDDNGGGRPEPAASVPIVAEAPTAANGVRDTSTVLGQPFTIEGVTHTPADIADYDDVGYASWYGAEFAGRPTANGESFNPGAISGAHKTLPLPSYVEVTALDSGRTILVRINDRGPMDNSRIIDLSQAAAEQLGIADRPAAVRVRRVGPPESERTQLRAGQRVPERLDTPESLLTILRNKASTLTPPRGASAVAVAAPRPVASTPVRDDAAKPSDGDRFIVEGAGSSPTRTSVRTAPAEPADKPTAVIGDYIVQVAAYSVKARADAAARKTGGSVSQAGTIWRVRLGPFKDEKAAQAALSSAKAKGFGEARIMRDR